MQKVKKLKKQQKRNNSFKEIIVLNKKEGETPLEALSFFRSKHKEYIDVPMTYAGRLDPMASGLLLVLSGDECKNKEKYLALDKEYSFEILFGFNTDTYDILGIVLNSFSDLVHEKELEKKIKHNLSTFKGRILQKYPIYSSKTVSGRQLWQYGRSGEVVEIPEREVFVKSLKFLYLKKINSKQLLNNIEKRIKKIKGDFRQDEILKTWHKKLSFTCHDLKGAPQSFFIASFSIKCSSGTYVRGIANSLGEEINIPALAFSIKRTKIGKYATLD